MKKLKKIPHFKTEEEENRFWQRVDSTQYVDWDKAEHWVFPNLKLTSRPITLHLPCGLINDYKLKAHKMGLPYQGLMKQVLYKGLATI